MRQRATLSFVCVVVALAFGCTRASTVVKVKNAADVSLAFQRIGTSTTEPVATGTADVNLRLSAIDVDEDGYMQRENGVLRITCKRCEGQTFTLLDGERLSARVDDSTAELLAASRGAGRVQLPFEYDVSSAEQIYPMLRTPNTNVEYFEQTTEPVSEIGWLLVPGAALLLIGLVVIPDDAVAGMLLFTPGLAMAAVGGLHLVLPEKIERFDARGNAISRQAARPPAAPTPATTSEAGASAPAAASDDAQPEADASADDE